MQKNGFEKQYGKLKYTESFYEGKVIHRGWKKSWKFLFGIVKVSLYIEDRYPDDRSFKNPSKYKHHFNIFIFGRRVYNNLYRSSSFSSIYFLQTGDANLDADRDLQAAESDNYIRQNT